MEQYEVLRSHDSRRLSSPAEYVSTIGTSKHDFLSDWGRFYVLGEACTCI